tara:strand:+ start:206 stop:1096 length:891 start_codon:yes stop_codon:yes gene_type:complete
VLIDIPNNRSSHISPKPRGGGIIFILITVFAGIIEISLGSFNIISYLPLISLPLALVGAFDDYKDTPAIYRYLVQLSTVIIIIKLSLLTSLLTFNLLNIFLLTLLTITLTAIINFTNFMDGVDGLIGSCYAVMLLTSATKFSDSSIIWILLGSLLGFLIWNWSPSKLFMGDAGSTFLGIIFSGVILQTSNFTTFIGLLLTGFPLWADACLCVLRRFKSKQNIFTSHKLHLYQRLHQAGWSHSKVSLVYLSTTSFISLSFLTGGLKIEILSCIIVLSLGIFLEVFYAKSFYNSLQGK